MANGLDAGSGPARQPATATWHAWTRRSLRPSLAAGSASGLRRCPVEGCEVDGVCLLHRLGPAPGNPFRDESDGGPQGDAGVGVGVPGPDIEGSEPEAADPIEGSDQWLRASPDFPDEARPLIGPRFRSGVRLRSRQAVRCWRAEQGGAPERSDAERPSQPDGPHGRVHEQPNPPPKPCQGSGHSMGERGPPVAMKERVGIEEPDLIRCETSGMEFADRIRRELSAVERRALSDAVEQVDDFLLAELVELYHEAGQAVVPRPFTERFLPGRYVDFYDFKMIRRLYACLLVVAGRLQDGWEPPRCRGEELVLRAVLEPADVCFEESSGEETSTFYNLRDLLFEDLDHEYLFVPAFDGIDDPDTYEGSQMRVEPLHPSAWFQPLRGASAVHPMIS